MVEPSQLARVQMAAVSEMVDFIVPFIAGSPAPTGSSVLRGTGPGSSFADTLATLMACYAPSWM
jgi:hypothetical protein